MSSIKISGGDYRGRNISFSLKKFSGAEITPQKVKGAVFSILGEDLRGKVFLDLFSCSGQIGIEAISRHASFVIFNDYDRKRAKHIMDYISDLGREGDTLVLSLHADRALRKLRIQGLQCDIIYLDPPYSKNEIGMQLYQQLLEYIEKYDTLLDNGLCMIQHYTKNKMPEKVHSMILEKKREYGTTALSLYKKVSTM